LAIGTSEALRPLPAAEPEPRPRLRRAAAAPVLGRRVVLLLNDGFVDLAEGDDAVAVVPGEEVALHWLPIPAELTRPQALAAARHMLSELSAQPAAELHVALSDPLPDGRRCAAACSLAAMERWTAMLADAGIETKLILPSPLLIAEPEEGLVSYGIAGTALVRGPGEAFAAPEPQLLELLLAGREPRQIAPGEFEAGLPDVLAHPLLNLRQGAFVQRRTIIFQRSFRRRLMGLVSALLILSLGVEIAAAYRESAAADAAETEARETAVGVLPPGTPVDDPAVALKRRLAELGGGRGGLTASSAALFTAIRDTPNIEIAGLRFAAGGGLRVSVRGNSVATLEAARGRLEASGYDVAGSPPAAGRGQAAAEWTVQPR